MRIIFMGTPRFAVPSLEALVLSGEEVVAAVSQPDRPAGRGHEVVSPPVKEYAAEKGFAILQPQKIKEPAFLARFEGLKPDLAVVVAFGRILPSELLKIPKLGCINIHASLLPKYRGAAPIQWAIMNGESETGVTTMYMDEGMDTGPILLQEKIEILPTETAGQLAERLSHLGSRLLIRTLDQLKKGKLQPRPQDHTLATYAPLLKKEQGRIQWEQDARRIYNLIRGLDPWPGAYTFYKNERWRILNAEVGSEEPTAGPPGRIVRAEKVGLTVSTGRGILALLELQPANSRPMTVQQYLTGHSVEEGLILQ